jgi:hypothetical protein
MLERSSVDAAQKEMEAHFAIWRQSLVKYGEERNCAATRSVKYFTLNPMPGNSQ